MGLNLPFGSMPDMEDGFTQSTSMQPGKVSSSSGMNWTSGTVSPPPKGKQKQKYREPVSETESESDKTDTQRPDIQQ